MALAVYSALVDTATTWWILLADPTAESNVVVQGLVEVHVGVAMAAFAGFAVLLVALALARIEWVSTVAATYLVVSFGVSGTSNLAFFATGFSVLGRVFPDVAFAIAYVFPTLGLVGGTGIHWLRHGGVPWRRALAISALVVGSMVALPALVAP